MNRREILALVTALVLGVPTLAAADQYLYEGTNQSAEGVVAIQQHTVFIEIIDQRLEEDDHVQIHQFAAVVVLAKRCIRFQGKNEFDNAVLWFNDQFLFGSKNRQDFNTNRTEGRVLGVQSDPDNDTIVTLKNAKGEMETHRLIGEDTMDPNGLMTIDTDGTAKAVRRFPSDPDPDPTGILPNPGRWVGCFIPDGFLFAIGSDDPYGLGVVPTLPVGGAINIALFDGPGNDNNATSLFRLDNHNACQGCIFDYVGSFYITDPNDKNWIIDKFVYPAALIKGEQLTPGPDDVPDCLEDLHVNDDLATACGEEDAERHRHRAEDNSGTDDRDNHCFDDPSGECEADQSDPTDTPREESVKFTTLEPLYAVHLQVDTDQQGILDEALWVWRGSGTVRNGAPRYEGDAAGECPVDNLRLDCALEYNAVIAVDFEAFDDIPFPVGPPLATPGAAEDEIQRRAKNHGTGGLDDGDESKMGNSHPHNPSNVVAGDSGPLHYHDVVFLDLFVVQCDSRLAPGGVRPCLSPALIPLVSPNQKEAHVPWFLNQPANAYWRDAPLGSVNLARPPAANDTCTGAAAGETHPMGSAPFTGRIFIVCDVTGAAADFHLHDGTETITS